MSEVCPETCRDGPPQELDLFKRDGGGHKLRPSGFSRRCAELWREQFGRRAARDKERSDKGKRQTGWRLRGSPTAAELIHAEGTRSLAALARADGAVPAASRGESRATPVGVCRGKVVRTMRRSEAPPPTKSVDNFRKTKSQRTSAKQKCSACVGLDAAKPALLRKAGAATGMP